MKNYLLLFFLLFSLSAFSATTVTIPGGYIYYGMQVIDVYEGWHSVGYSYVVDGNTIRMTVSQTVGSGGVTGIRGYYSNYSTGRTYVVWSPPSTGVPVPTSNVLVNVVGSFSNPYSFPVDLFFEFEDAAGNVIDSVFLQTVPAGATYAYADWLQSHLTQDQIDLCDGIANKAVVNSAWAASHPAEYSLVDHNGDGSIDAFISTLWEFDYLGSKAPTFSPRASVSNTIAAAGNKPPNTKYTNTVTLTGGGSSPSINAVNSIINGASSTNSVTVGASISALGSAMASAAGVGAALDLSGVVGAVNAVNSSVNDQGDILKTKLDDLLGVGSSAPSSGNFDPVTDDPSLGYSELTGSGGYNALLESSSTLATDSRDSIGSKIGSWVSISFPSIGDRQYVWTVPMWTKTMTIDLSPYQQQIEMIRALQGWLITCIFAFVCLRITRKGIA
jgi:hypothetical protein